MTQGTSVGDFSYTQLTGGTGYALKVKLSNDKWSSPLPSQRAHPPDRDAGRLRAATDG